MLKNELGTIIRVFSHGAKTVEAAALGGDRLGLGLRRALRRNTLQRSFERGSVRIDANTGDAAPADLDEIDAFGKARRAARLRDASPA